MDSPRQEIHDNQGYEGMHHPLPLDSFSSHSFLPSLHDLTIDGAFSPASPFLALLFTMTTGKLDPERVPLNLHPDVDSQKTHRS